MQALRAVSATPRPPKKKGKEPEKVETMLNPPLWDAARNPDFLPGGSESKVGGGGDGDDDGGGGGGDGDGGGGGEGGV